jgi:hypothetical protein
MKFDQHARFCLTMLIIYIIFIGACVYSERAHSSENVLEFDTWQVTIQQDGWPKLRYLNYATMTSYVLGYMASTSCADVKFEYRRFIEKDIDVPVDATVDGAFAINGKRFDFPATVPTVADVETLQVIQAIWTPEIAFFSELIKADRIHWRDDIMATDAPSIEISMEGFVPMLNHTMDICQEKYEHRTTVRFYSAMVTP